MICHKKFDFSDYRENLLPQHKGRKSLKQSFLEWFVGFSEGNGSFVCTTNKRIMFIINQKETLILQKIRTELGFGRVSTYKTYFRYVVADRESLARLIAIFNGNLHLRKSHLRFSRWLSWRNSPVTSPISPKERLNLSLPLIAESSWLAGFTDAEGCFNAQRIVDPRYSLGYRVRLGFSLDQLGERETLLLLRDYLGGGSVSIRKRENNPQDEKHSLVCQEDEKMWRLSTWSLKSHEKLLNYFALHSVRSKKQISLKRFSSLYNYIIKRKTIPWQGKVLKRVNNLLDRLEAE